MKLDEKKELFISLLRARLSDEDDDSVFLSETVLRENGLVGDTFWGVICSSLIKDGVLKECPANPTHLLLSFNAVADDPEVKHLQWRLDLLREQRSDWPRWMHNPRSDSRDSAIDAEMEGIYKRIDEIKEVRLKHSTHEFVIDRKKLLTSDATSSTENSFYIMQIGDDFKYKGILLTDLSKDSDYYKCFDALFSLVSEGGIAPYGKLQDEIKRRIPKTKSMTKTNLRKFLQRNLTDEQNGFVRYADIDATVSGGKKLIHAIRGKGIEFNNRKS